MYVAACAPAQVDLCYCLLEDFCFFCWQLKQSWHNTLTMEKGIEYKFFFLYLLHDITKF